MPIRPCFIGRRKYLPAPISIGAITQTTPGVFTVLVTATDAGTLRLKIPAGAIITDPAGNPLVTTSDILDNVTLGIYMPDSTTPTLRGMSPVANSSGKTLTLAEWQNTERNHPAPWADFQSDS